MPISSPLHVDQRATRVAGIDRRVGLNEVFILLDVQSTARPVALTIPIVTV